MAEETNPDAEGMDEDLADEWAAAMSEAGESESGESGEGLDDEWAAAMSEQDVKPVQLDQLGSSAGGALSSDMDLIMDIPVTLSMELGNTEIAIRNLALLCPNARDALAKVDRTRIDVGIGLFREIGFSENEAKSRAKILYTSSIGTEYTTISSSLEQKHAMCEILIQKD